MSRLRNQIFTYLTAASLLPFAAAGISSVSLSHAAAPPKRAAAKKPAVAAPGGEPLRFVAPIGQSASFEKIVATPDGKYLLTCGGGRAISVWNAATGLLIRQLVSEGNVTVLAVSQNSRYLVSGDYVGKLICWDLSTAARVHTYSPYSGVQGENEDWRYTQLAVSPDGTKAAFSFDGKMGNSYLRIIDPRTGKLLADKFPPHNNMEHLVFSPDGARLYWDTLVGSGAENDGSVFDLATGKTARSKETPFAFDGDGNLLTQRKYDTRRGDFTRVVSAKTGKLIREFASASAQDGKFAFDTKRNRLAFIQGFEKKISVHALPSGKSVAEIPLDKEDISVGTFLAGGQIAVAGRDSDAAYSVLFRCDVAKKEVVGTIGGRNLREIVGLAGDPRYVFVSEGDKYVLYDLRDNLAVRKFTAQDKYFGATMSQDGTLVLISSYNGVRLYDLRTGELRFQKEFEGFPTITMSSDGKYVALTDTDNKAAVEIIDTGTAKTVATIPLTDRGDGTKTRSLAFGSGSELLFEGSSRGVVTAWEWRTGKKRFTKEFAGPAYAYNDREIFDLLPSTSDPNHLLVTQWNGIVQDLDITTQKPTLKFGILGQERSQRPAMSPDGRLFAQADDSNTIVIFSAATGKPVGRLAGHTATVNQIRFTPDSKRLVSLSGDSTTRVWDVATGKEQMGYVLAQADDELTTRPPEWIAYTPDGHFEASEGANKLVHFARGMQIFDADQFYEKFYQSGLTRAVFAGMSLAQGGGKGGNFNDALKNGVPPTVKLVLPKTASSSTVEVVVEATEQAGGGVKAIRLYHNDRLVGGPAALRGIAVEAVAGQTTTKKFTVPLASGENVFRAVAYSKTDIESRAAAAKLMYAPSQVAKPTLHILAVGVNKYQDATMNLSYARPDAEAIADFFEKGGAEASLFGKVAVTRLLDADATGKAILESLTALAKTSTPDDVVFVYLAGHGETADGVWHFLPTEMRQMALPERVKELGIAWPKVEEAISKITARKVVLVVDACKSGAALGGKTRGSDDSQQTLAVMARAQGIHILTASTSQQYAGEVQALGHGILTYALLEGLGGKGLKSNTIMIRELMGYVETRVPALSKQYRGEEQYPVPFGRGQNFPVAAR